MEESGYVKAHCDDGANPPNSRFDLTEQQCRSRNMVWVDEKEVGIQLVGFFKGQVEARVRGKVTLFGNTLTWDESFDRDELLDAAGKFLSKVIKIIVKWF